MIWLTANLPGSGGVLRSDPLDFIVEEIPSYLPAGEGEHLMVRIEKVGITTAQAIHRLADAAHVRAREIGAAGMKDRAAVARQWLSLPWPIKSPLPDLSSAIDGELKILEVGRHINKLKRGHQRGNRFLITVRDVPSGGFERALAILASLRASGVPNAYGPQRFGARGDNAEQALAILRGEARAPRDPRVAGLLRSALQSRVFNRTLELRMERGLFTKALAGDIMQKHDTGGLFDSTDPVADQPRVDQLAISPTGPLPGPKMKQPSGMPRAMEAEALEEVGLTEDEVARLDEGTRRALRYPIDPEAKLERLDDHSYRLEVGLPSGAFATVLLGELMKPEGGLVLRNGPGE